MRGVARIRQNIFRRVPRVEHVPESLPASACSPELHFDTGLAVIADHLRVYVDEQRHRGKFLDVGGGEGWHRPYAGRLEYVVLDLEPRPGGIVGDICNCPQLAGDSFDVVFSHNTFEHLSRPWLAAREIGRILRPGGLACIYTWFAIRYHPVPSDYFRFSHNALRVLFEEEGGLETLDCGYDLQHRRDDRNGKLADHADLAPVDALGGWLENWPVWWVGRKP